MNDKIKKLSTDTTPKIIEYQQAWFTMKTPEERLMIGLQMAEDDRKLALTDIRM